MKFMLFTYRDPSVQLDAEQRATVPAAVAAWCDEMDARGVRLAGHVLGPRAESRTIWTRAGETTVEQAPLTDHTLQIAGFNILECEDIDEALRGRRQEPRRELRRPGAETDRDVTQELTHAEVDKMG